MDESSEKDLRGVGLELMVTAVSAIHALCEDKVEPEDVNRWVMEFSLFILCANAVRVMSVDEFSALTRAGFVEMKNLGGEEEWHTTRIQ